MTSGVSIHSSYKEKSPQRCVSTEGKESCHSNILVLSSLKYYDILPDTESMKIFQLYCEFALNIAASTAAMPSPPLTEAELI